MTSESEEPAARATWLRSVAQTLASRARSVRFQAVRDVVRRPIVQDLAARAKPLAPYAVALVVAVFITVFWRITDTRLGFHGTLIDMGFDPGRAELLGALTLGAMVAAAIELLLDRVQPAVVLGALAAGADDAGAFRKDTIATMQGGPAVGGLDPVGWLETGLAILLACVVVAWAAMTLARPVRAWAVRTRDAIVEINRSRRPSPSFAIPASWLGALLVFVILGPVLGSLLNYGTDSVMHSSDLGRTGLFGDASGGSPDPDDLLPTLGPSLTPAPQASVAGATSSTAPSASPGPGTPTPEPSPEVKPLIDGPAPGSKVTPHALLMTKPWKAWVPSGKARWFNEEMPRYWEGTSGANAMDVYLPPGYDADPLRRYPVIYEVPYNSNMWTGGMDFFSVLTSLITSGELPPMIVIFVWADSPIYRDTECSNSYDGRMWFEKYMVETVVPTVDSEFRTIRTPLARTTMGASKGGYCAASLLTHHPELFGNAIAFSGYYTAAAKSAQTAGTDLVFGQNLAYEKSQSPIRRLATIPSAQRDRMFVVQCANPSEDFYGAEMKAFSDELLRTGVAQALLPSKLGHSWEAQRAEIPVALGLISARQVRLGVFGDVASAGG
jgi:enterochelin esterase-like enzyme